MAQLNLKKLQALLKADTTPAALAELGLSRVPVTPSGEIRQPVLEAFLSAGQPTDDFFDGHKVLTLADWDDLRQQRVVVELDPITGEILVAEDAAAWRAAAPVKVRFGDPVAAADLFAFGAPLGLLPPGTTSAVLDLLPTGTEPVEPSRTLRRAALEWPYNPNAPRLAQQRRFASRRPAAAKPSPTAAQPTVTVSARERFAALLGDIFPGDTFIAFLREREGDAFVLSYDGSLLPRDLRLLHWVNVLIRERRVNSDLQERLNGRAALLNRAALSAEIQGAFSALLEAGDITRRDLGFRS